MKHALVVTTIAQQAPPALFALGEGAAKHGWPFYLIGDQKSPQDFAVPYAQFYSPRAQLRVATELAQGTPFNHYARKNVGYVLAANEGADVIVETDDDNEPRPEFWAERKAVPAYSDLRVDRCGWINVAQRFCAAIWPRGFPLTKVRKGARPFAYVDNAGDFLFLGSPIQQGMASGDPDVDAIFRMLHHGGEIPISAIGPQVVLGPGSWCPINSQNTTWFRAAFPLLYLPSSCNSRCSDIWRGLIAQRIVWTVPEWGGVLFHGATVVQNRNPHDLLDDFEQEIPLYLYTARAAEILRELTLEPGIDAIPRNMVACYKALGKKLPLFDGPQEIRMLEQLWFPALGVA
jgi:hypothetical protein